METDWLRADRLGAELRQVIDGSLAQLPDPAAVRPQPQKPSVPLATARQLLGIEGRISLAGGGMDPVDLGQPPAEAARRPAPQPARPAGSAAEPGRARGRASS